MTAPRKHLILYRICYSGTHAHMQLSLYDVGLTHRDADSPSPISPTEYFWEPGHQTLTCTIYLYTCARTGEKVYVGQTVQEPKARDRGHRNRWQTVFDRSYVEDGQYVFTVLEQRVFEADIGEEADDRALHAKAQAWLDGRETYFIDYCQTYDPTGAGPGLNQTRGGQSGALVAYVQAARRDIHRRWRELYAPGFEAWLAANRTSLLHVKRADTVPAPEALDGVLPLGQLVHHFRTGKTAVPAQWRAWLDERGFLWHTRNLATHVQRRLQRLKDQLPTTAPALAQDAEVTAAISALYGTGSFGLASESLVELEARYLGDLARL